MKKSNQFSLFLVLFLIVSCGFEEPKQKETVHTVKKVEISPSTNGVKDQIQENDTVINTVIDSINIEPTSIVHNKENVIQKIDITDKMDINKEEIAPIAEEIKKETTIVPETPEEIAIVEVIEDPFPQRVSHDNWNTLLKKHVSSSGKVDYKGFKTDRNLLNQYLEHLSDVSPTSEWSKNEKLAYWINLYNASTVKLIIDNYPVKSITEINNGKPWDHTFIAASGNYYTLNQIENDIIRPRFKEAKIHVAVNCAAVSCPPLMNSAFLPEKLQSQLTKRAKSFINNSNNNTIATDKIEVSKIFDWYKVDFEKGGGVIGFINKYSDKSVNKNATITYLEYNWNLNEK